MGGRVFFMAQSTESRRLQAARAREAFFQQFASSEAKSEHYRTLAQRSVERRVVLSGAEADALRHALMLLSSIPALQDLGASTTQACENEAVAGVAA